MVDGGETSGIDVIDQGKDQAFLTPPVGPTDSPEQQAFWGFVEAQFKQAEFDVELASRLNPDMSAIADALDPSDPEKADRWGYVVTDTGAWAEVTPERERARDPSITWFVNDGPEAEKIDWDSGFKGVSREGFQRLMSDSLEVLAQSETYTTTRTIGEGRYALPVTTITDHPAAAAFSTNMFLPGLSEEELAKSELAAQKPPINIIMLPGDEHKIDPADFGLEEQLGTERTPTIIMDVETNTVLIRGFAYHGPIKKGAFTLMNHHAPDMEGVLPMHASATVFETPSGERKRVVLAGLSGTGKSTLSKLGDQWPIADDETLVTPDGVFDMENGLFPIVLGLAPETEPALYDATFSPREPAENRSLLQNVVVDPDTRSVLIDDASLTDNTRGSVPKEYLERNASPEDTAGKVDAFVFITKDQNGVLPPIAKLTPAQAKLWFTLGPTSRSSAEVGAVPEPVFSRFFGAPFMTRRSEAYAERFGEILDREDAPDVILINTGFTGGPADEGGSRIGIPETEAMLFAALSGDLDFVDYRVDKRFGGIRVPIAIPGDPRASRILDVRSTWADRGRYDKEADRYAGEFRDKVAQVLTDPAMRAELEEAIPRPLAT